MDSDKIGWTYAERETEGAKHMERVLKSMVRTWDAGFMHQDPALMDDWIAHVVNRAKGILRVYGKSE